jgi:hypothetical protein
MSNINEIISNNINNIIDKNINYNRKDNIENSDYIYNLNRNREDFAIFISLMFLFCLVIYASMLNYIH